MTKYTEKISDGLEVTAGWELNMPELHLLRVAQNETTTFGVLTYRTAYPICLTIENKWECNTPYISCIPDGLYICESGIYSKATNSSHNPSGISYKILNIPGRSDCIFHPGNSHHDTSGCIIPVTSYGMTWNKKHGEHLLGGLGSRDAFGEFRQACKDSNKIMLNIESTIWDK